MNPLRSLVEELDECERDHLAFLLKYSCGDLDECCALAKVGRAKLLKLIAKHGLQLKKAHAAPAKQRAAAAGRPRLAKADRIKSACARAALCMNEIHARIGGSYGSLGVYIARMKARGELIASGQKGHFRYRAAACHISSGQIVGGVQA